MASKVHNQCADRGNRYSIVAEASINNEALKW